MAYEDVSYTFEEMSVAHKDSITDMNPLGTVPVIELNCKILIQSCAILRQFARLWGEYDGENEEEKYWVYTLYDIVIDCRSLFEEVSRAVQGC